MAVAVLGVSLAITAILLVTSMQLAPSEPEAVAPASVRMVVHAQGTVSPRTEADLVPEVSGNVVWISPNLVSGGYFEEGEPLLRIDDRDNLSTLERARAAVNRTTAEDEFARFELERLQEMEARRLISPSDVETGMRAARVAAAALDDARAALEQAERDLSGTEVIAPFTGLVRAEQVDPGQFVSRGAPIARLYAVDYVEIRLPIADRQLAYLDLPPLQRGELDEATAPDVVLSAEFAGKQYQWHGKLARTEAEIDLRSRMIHAVARVSAADNAATDPDYVPPPVGLFVNAEIQGRSTENIVVLPRSAIRNGNQVLVVICLVFSVIESQFILPAHLAHRKVTDPDTADSCFAERWSRIQSRISFGIERFAHDTFGRALERVLEWRYVTLTFGFGALPITLALIASGRVEIQFLPATEGDNLVAQLEMPEGIDVAETARAARQIEAAAIELKAELDAAYPNLSSLLIRHVFSSVGQPLGGLFRTAPQSHTAELVLALLPLSERGNISVTDMAERWRELTGPIYDSVSLTFGTTGLEIGDAISIQLQGRNVNDLALAAAELRGELARFERVVDISDSFRTGKQEVRLSLRVPRGDSWA